MYAVIAIISGIVRLFYLPNPFEEMENPFIINCICEPFIQRFTYEVVSLYYKQRSNPAVGSLLYLGFYVLHIVLIRLVIHLGYKSVLSIIIYITYFIVLILIALVKKFIKDVTDL